MFIRTFYVDVECIVLGGVIERIARYVHLGPWDSIKIARLITLIWDSWSQMPVELFYSLSYGVQVASPMDTKASSAVRKYI